MSRPFQSVIDVPRAWGEPLATARLKSTPEDFIVRESLDFEIDDQGEHLYLQIRKCDLNTHEVAEQLQRLFNCKSVDIGIAGLKDKVAVTDQWFSIRTPLQLHDTSINSQSADMPVSAGEFVVLESKRHSRKLRRGAHRHNHFIITLRDFAASDLLKARADIDSRLHLIQRQGFANYFGPQRFGIDQNNLTKAERYFTNPKRKISRLQRSMAISAARSLLFNQVCADRVRAKNWNVPLQGEPMMLDGSHSYFINDQNGSDIQERCRTLDIHPSGPMWGDGEVIGEGLCKQFESDSLMQFKTFTDGLAKAGLKQQRRALRASVGQLSWQWQDSNALTLDFNLLKGAYATSFLSEFVIY